MRRVVVRYRVKAERVSEHATLLGAVFAELEQRRPDGLSYEALRLADGVSFVHVATVTTDANPLGELPAFKAFVAGIAARCEEPPVSSAAEQLGRYVSAAVARVVASPT